MAVSKDTLVFDTTDATSIAHSDNVGAYVRAGTDGTQIGSQTVNSEDWLNTAAVLYDETGTAYSDANPLSVSITDGVNVEVDLSHVDDSVRLGDGTSFFTSTSENGDIALDVHISNSNLEVTQGTSPWVIGDGGGSITVDATDLDIRDLSASQDNIAISDGTDTMAVNADGSINSVVTATQLDIDDLNATDDAVQSWLYDGAGTALTSTLVGSDQALDVNVVQTVDPSVANTAIAHAVNAFVSDTAEDVVASPLANRKILWIRNMDNKLIYIGASGVTQATGFPISPGSMAELRIGAAVDIEFIGSAGNNPEIRTLELS